jgi:hypothetical protein
MLTSASQRRELKQRLLQQCHSNTSCNSVATTLATTTPLRSRDRCYSNNIAMLARRELQKQCRSARTTRVATALPCCRNASCSSVSLHRCNSTLPNHRHSVTLRGATPLPAIAATTAKLCTSDVSWTSVHGRTFVHRFPSCTLRPAAYCPTPMPYCPTSCRCYPTSCHLTSCLFHPTSI